MQIIKPSVELISITPHPEYKIANAARICYAKAPFDNDDIVSKEGARKICKMLMNNKHMSPFEMADASVKVTCSRAISHELVRHRLCSFLQESQRYVIYKEGVNFVEPEWTDNADAVSVNEWMELCHKSEMTYNRLLSKGLRPEEAREELPNSTATKILIKANFREWLHIFDLRLYGKTGNPHPEMVRVMKLIHEAFAEETYLFDEDFING